MQNGTNWSGYEYETHHLPQMWGGFYLEYTPFSTVSSPIYGPTIKNWNVRFDSRNLHSGQIPIVGSVQARPNSPEFLRQYGVKPENIHIDSNHLEGYPYLYLYVDWPFYTQHSVHSGVSSHLNSRAYKEALDNVIREVNLPSSTIFDVQTTYVESLGFTIPQFLGRHSGYAFVHGKNVLKFDDTIYYINDDKSITITPTGNVSESHLNVDEGVIFSNNPSQSGKFSCYMPSLYLKNTVVSGTKYYYDYESIPNYINPQVGAGYIRDFAAGAQTGNYVYVKFKFDRTQKKTVKTAINDGIFRIAFYDYPTIYEDYANASTNNTTIPIETNRIKRAYTPPTGIYLEEFDLYGFPPSGEFNEMWITVQFSGSPYTCYYRGLETESMDWFALPTQIVSNPSGYALGSTRHDHLLYYPVYDFTSTFMYDNVAESGYKPTKLSAFTSLNSSPDFQGRQRLVNNPIDYFLPIRWWKGTKEVINEEGDLPNGLSWRFSKPRFEIMRTN